MNDFLYWFLFAILISLLVIFASYLLINIVRDHLKKPLDGEIQQKVAIFTDEIQNPIEEFRSKEGSLINIQIELTSPRSLEIHQALLDVEKRVKFVENEAILFAGGKKNLHYYNINEKYIKLMIELCDIKCDENELRDRKNQIMLHIEHCQNILKLKC